MLDEFMNFNDKKMPNPNEILKPKEYIIKKEQPKNIIKKPKKQSIINLDGMEELKKLEEETLKLIKEQEALTLAEQILKRQQDEQDRKRREILKQLHKTKNVDINKFLTRSVGYEQKKNYDLEQKRFKQLEEETKLCKERPLLSRKTAEMCKTLYKKPIYERTKEIIEKREKNLNELKNKDYKYNPKLRSAKNKSKSKNKKANNSMDNINTKKEVKRKKKEYIINEKTKNKKMNSSEMRDYYQRQNDWKNKIEEKNKMKEKNRKNKKVVENEESFHPKISPGTIEIINAKNEASGRVYGHQNTDYNNYYFTKNDIYKNKMNLGKSVYDRLYEENALFEMKKNEYKNKAACSFRPFTNKNKYKQIQPKYNIIKTNNKGNKRSRNINKLKEARSVEVDRKKGETIDINLNNKNRMNSSFDYGKIEKKKNLNEPWTNVLLKLKNNKNSDDDFSYRLNIRQASAWNENDVNTIQCRGVSKEIVKDFL